jgi:hypothetical protein
MSDAPVDVAPSPAPQASPEDLNAKLRQWESDPDWRARIDARDPVTTAEWRDVLGRIDGGNRVVDTRMRDVLDVLNGKIAAPTGPETLTRGQVSRSTLEEFATRNRELGINDEVTLQGATGKSDVPVSTWEHLEATRRLARREADPDWRRRLWSGDPEARREFRLIHTILTSEVVG